MPKSKCQHNSCEKKSSFGQEGTKEAKFCKAHKAVTDVDLKNKRCKYLGCCTRPTYGNAGTKEANFCLDHKGSTDVNVM